MSLTDALEYSRVAEVLLEGREYQVASAPVLVLSRESGCTAYDCEFVHIAKELGVPLVTSDREVLRAFPELTVSIAEFGARPPAA